MTITYQKGQLLEYTIPSYFLSYIFNGDDSGIDPEDVDAWTEFENGERLPRGHWATVEDESGEATESYFSWTNDVTTLGSDVTDLVYVVMEDKTVTY